MLKKILIGCGILALLGMIGLVLLILGVIHMAQDPEGLEFKIEAPLEIPSGQTFQLVVHAKNTRAKKTMSVGDVDVSNDYLQGFSIVSITPKPKSTMSTDLKIASIYSSTFNDKIPAGEEHTYTFTLKARKPGKYQGDVDIYVGMRSLTEVVETTVTDAKPTAAVPPLPTETKSGATVVLKEVDPARKIKVIVEIRALKPELGLKEAKDLVDNTPAIVLMGVSREDAEKARQKLAEAGAEVEVQ